MDAIESPLPTSPSPSSSLSPQRHFYLAVDRLQFKMETLVDLLSMAGRRPCLPMVVCCSTRDELDAICSAVSNLSSYIYVSSLYSDQSEGDRMRILDNFRQATGRWNRMGRDEVNGETEKEEHKSHLVVFTDACLPLVGSGEPPISARILVNYELPTKKVKKESTLFVFASEAHIIVHFHSAFDIDEEMYTRRMATCLAAEGIVINMVVGGEVVTLKNLEESSGLVIAEMPIHIFEML